MGLRPHVRDPARPRRRGRDRAHTARCARSTSASSPSAPGREPRPARTSRTSRAPESAERSPSARTRPRRRSGGRSPTTGRPSTVFAGWQTGEMRVSVDDEIRGGKMIDAIVANGRYLGGGMMMLPEAEPDDGLFDVLLIGDVTKRDLLFTLPKSYRGSTCRTRGSRCSADASSPWTRTSRSRSRSTASSPERRRRDSRSCPALRLRVPRGGEALRSCAEGFRGVRLRAGRLLQRRELLLELDDPFLERVDPAHLLREIVDARTKVVERRERALTARKVGDPLATHPRPHRRAC